MDKKKIFGLTIIGVLAITLVILYFEMHIVKSIEMILSLLFILAFIAANLIFHYEIKNLFLTASIGSITSLSIKSVPPFHMSYWRLWMIAVIIYACLMPIYSGIIKKKLYARRLAIIFAVPYFTIIFPLMFIFKLKAEVENFHNTMGTQPFLLDMNNIDKAMPSFWGGTCVCIILMICGLAILYKLTRPQVKEQFK